MPLSLVDQGFKNTVVEQTYEILMFHRRLAARPRPGSGNGPAPDAQRHPNIRAKLKRLTSRGILIETEPGLFTQP